MNKTPAEIKWTHSLLNTKRYKQFRKTMTTTASSPYDWEFAFKKFYDDNKNFKDYDFTSIEEFYKFMIDCLYQDLSDSLSPEKVARRQEASADYAEIEEFRQRCMDVVNAQAIIFQSLQKNEELQFTYNNAMLAVVYQELKACDSDKLRELQVHLEKYRNTLILANQQQQNMEMVSHYKNISLSELLIPVLFSQHARENVVFNFLVSTPIFLNYTRMIEEMQFLQNILTSHNLGLMKRGYIFTGNRIATYNYTKKNFEEINFANLTLFSDAIKLCRAEDLQTRFIMNDNMINSYLQKRKVPILNCDFTNSGKNVHIELFVEKYTPNKKTYFPIYAKVSTDDSANRRGEIGFYIFEKDDINLGTQLLKIEKVFNDDKNCYEINTYKKYVLDNLIGEGRSTCFQLDADDAIANKCMQEIANVLCNTISEPAMTATRKSPEPEQEF